MIRLSKQRPAEITGLPVLSPGRHLDPTDGACLMEFTSQLAGEPWSDHPRCTHPALAEAARLVNDACPTGSQLARLAPDLIGLTGRDARVAPTLVALCVRAAVDTRKQRSRHGTGAGRRAERRLDRLGRGGTAARWTAFTDPLYRHGSARLAMARSIDEIRFAAGPGALLDLLRSAIAECRGLLQGSEAHSCAEVIVSQVR